MYNYFSNTQNAYYYFNKSIRIPFIRRVFSKVINMALPKLEPVKSPFIADLTTNGIIIWENFIDINTVENIKKYLLKKRVYNLSDSSKTPILLPTSSLHSIKLDYFPEDIIKCSEILELANRDEIISLAANYLGCKPIISTITARWIIAGEETNKLFDDDSYHRDAEDFRFLKLFVYLTDVTEEQAAHSFITKSHKSNKLTRRGLISNEQANAKFEKENIKIITGKAGCAFLEDTWGIHRSIPATSGSRLALIITYSQLACTPFAPSKPIAKNIYGVDRYINRAYLED